MSILSNDDCLSVYLSVLRSRLGVIARLAAAKEREREGREEAESKPSQFDAFGEIKFLSEIHFQIRESLRRNGAAMDHYGCQPNHHWLS